MNQKKSKTKGIDENIIWNLEEKEINELKEYDKNPRYLDERNESHLRKSIQKFGLCEPVVINTDNTIIGGHQRVRILKSLGYQSTRVYVPHRTLSEKEVEELNIRLNKNGGDWDDDILANLWDPIDLVDFGFELDDLGLEGKPKSLKPKDVKLVLSFDNSDLLHTALGKLSPILEDLDGCKYKVKA